MKISPNGNYLALAILGKYIIEVFRFDNQTGTVELIESIALPNKGMDGPYGVEFSPNSKMLYVSEAMTLANPRGSIYQWQLENRPIASTRFEIPSARNKTAALQLAIDGAIYVAISERRFLGRIRYPNRLGAASEFDTLAVDVNPNEVFGGLPGFVQSWLKPPAPEVVMPNVFTPNEDDKNSVFVPLVFKHLEMAEMRIYNRWGQLIFITNHPTKGWNGGDHPTGTYFWQITGEGADGMDLNQKGWLQLVR
jgi:gliding motility-associated-like protein